MSDPFRYYLIDDDVMAIPRIGRFTCKIEAAVIIMPRGAVGGGHTILWCHDLNIAERERCRAVTMHKAHGSLARVIARPVTELTAQQASMIRRDIP